VGIGAKPLVIIIDGSGGCGWQHPPGRPHSSCQLASSEDQQPLATESASSNELSQWLCYDNIATNIGRLFCFTGVHLLECCHVDDTSPNHTVVGLPQG